MLDREKIRFETLSTASSVARGAEGGSSSPTGLKSMQNSVFFALLRVIFALKAKIAPPKVIGVRLGEEAEMMWTRRSGSHLT